ncbi:sulfatase-like hydrolase/transferase [Planctomycetota bacterium]
MAADEHAPNIVFIMTDTQRYDMLGCNGSTFCQTPQLDRLAAGGLNFDRAYTTTPLCTPARAALFTGMYASSSGAAANQIPLFNNVRNTGQIFEQAGYKTGHIGKWHLDGPEGGYYGTGLAPEGFPQEVWYDGKCFQEEVGTEGFKRWKKGLDLQDQDCWAARVAQRAESFIAEHAAGKAPFYLIVSIDEPHGPSSAPEEYYNMYKGTQRQRSPNMDDTLEGKPAVQAAFEEYFNHNGRVPAGEDPNNNPRYYGCNSFADTQIGRVIDAVDSHCPDNTVIVYTSDHGDHAGSHGLLSKGPTMYEEITRIPLIVRAPGITVPGSRCERLFSHIDLAPTLFGLAGIEIPEQFEGGDAGAMLAEPQTSCADAIFMEYYRFGLPHHTRWGFQPIKCIRTDRYKLVINLLDRDELYDLQQDPGEMINCIDNKSMAAIRGDLHDRLLDWMDQRRDPLRGNGWWQRSWRPEHRMNPRHLEK